MSVGVSGWMFNGASPIVRLAPGALWTTRMQYMHIAMGARLTILSSFIFHTERLHNQRDQHPVEAVICDWPHGLEPSEG